MTTDLCKYKTLLDKFRGRVNESSFDSNFIDSTTTLSKNERFLVKMELKRLANPCMRSIDLRGLVNGQCRLYEHEGQSHFLDDLAIKTFEDNVELYGEYTFGVYEAVKNTENHFRVIYEKEQAGIAPTVPEVANKTVDNIQYPATRYKFSDYFERAEERMNFAIALTITLESNLQLNATSSDLSVNGCKFRLTEQPKLEVGDIITIKFTGLEQDFQFGSQDSFTYQIQNSHLEGSIQLLGCKRLDSSPKDAFKGFLKAYIQGNKRRYKINLDNTIYALQARSYEQFFLPKITDLPVFLEKKHKTLVPRYALTTNNNQAIFQYWQDEAGKPTLHALLNEERLKRLIATSNSTKSLIVYSFIHQYQGKSFFYTVDNLQLSTNDQLFTSFLAFAANKDSFAITELTYLNVDKSQSYAPFTLSKTLSIKKQYINLPPSDEVESHLALLPLAVVINDITHPSLVSQYQYLSSENINTAKLKLFGHKRTIAPSPVDELGITYKKQRQELRFIYHTDAIVECEKVKWTGVSQDFSVSGLKIKLNSSAVLIVGDIVYLTFPKLQKITSAFDLKLLPYEVVRINKNKTIINLRVHVKEHQHIGRSFFKLLIDKNRNKLTTDEYAMLIPGLGSALRTNYVKNMQTPVLVIQSSGSRYKVEVIGTNQENSHLLEQMKRLSDRKHCYNLYPLLTKLQNNNTLDQELRTLLANKEPVCQLIYIAINTEQPKVEKSVNVMLDSEFDSPEAISFFIRRALQRGEFYCLQLKLSRTDEPDMEYLNAELNYVSTYAIHRGKQIEQDIWSVAGVIQVVDITQEVLLRNELIME
ncbi:MAG: PilZ domain-containing protein [Litorilituus sp.]|nr:PilZ domain-containing protein [Litorilituus sp.]